MEYTKEMRDMQSFLSVYKEDGNQGIVSALAALEYAQFIENISFEEAKELMYRFIESIYRPQEEE